MYGNKQWQFPLCECLWVLDSSSCLPWLYTSAQLAMGPYNAWHLFVVADVFILRVEHLTHTACSCYAGVNEPQRESTTAAATPERATDTAFGAGVRIHIHLFTSFLQPLALLYIACQYSGECSPINMNRAMGDSAWVLGGAVLKPICVAAEGL